MKDPNLRRLKTIKHLLEIALEHQPIPTVCHDQYQCKFCNPSCKAMNTVHSALYWVEDTIKRLDAEEKLQALGDKDCQCQIEEKTTA